MLRFIEALRLVCGGCGPYRIRTGHLSHAMGALYQMS